MHAPSADGTRVGCELLGDGPPLLVIHGATADRSRWAAVRDALAERFRVHLMDRRGRGLSAEEAAGGYALAREADDIRALVSAIGAPVLVLAHSYGGLCALEAARDCDGIARMLVYEPAFGTADGPPLSPPGALDEIDAALARGDREAALTTFFRRMLEYDDAELARARALPMWEARLAAAHTLAREGRTAGEYRIDPRRMAAIGVPVRFLVGSETPVSLVRSTRAAHAAVPGSELRELPGQAHVAMETAPELFVSEVVDWLLPA